MNATVLDFYREFSIYTNPGLYGAYLNELPDDIRELGFLIRKNIIHRSTLVAGNVGTNADKKFGDMSKVPWYRQPEDDVLVTAAAMLAELYRRDERGFIEDRQEKDKLILTCRFVSILIAAILKSKGIPCRVRAGHAPYFNMGELGTVSTDHWINQYWNAKEKKWITIDVDGSWSLNEEFDPYDLPSGKFDFSADAWLAIRNKKINPDHFYNSGGKRGAVVVFWSLFYDFHCLMNDEIIYLYGPKNGWGIPERFDKLTETELKQIDNLASLMQDSDKNFKKLQDVWIKNKEFRLLSGALL